MQRPPLSPVKKWIALFAACMAGCALAYAVQNFLHAQNPGMNRPFDQRLIPEWEKAYALAPAWLFAAQWAAWTLGSYLAARWGAFWSRGEALQGLAAGMAVWSLALLEAFQAPYSWAYRLGLIPVVLIAPIAGTMRGRVAWRKAEAKRLQSDTGAEVIES